MESPLLEEGLYTLLLRCVRNPVSLACGDHLELKVLPLFDLPSLWRGQSSDVELSDCWPCAVLCGAQLHKSFAPFYCNTCKLGCQDDSMGFGCIPPLLLIFAPFCLAMQSTSTGISDSESRLGCVQSDGSWFRCVCCVFNFYLGYVQLCLQCAGCIVPQLEPGNCRTRKENTLCFISILYMSDIV